MVAKIFLDKRIVPAMNFLCSTLWWVVVNLEAAEGRGCVLKSDHGSSNSCWATQLHVTLGKSCNSSGPRFLHLENEGNNNSYLTALL